MPWTGCVVRFNILWEVLPNKKRFLHLGNFSDRLSWQELSVCELSVIWHSSQTDVMMCLTNLSNLFCLDTSPWPILLLNWSYTSGSSWATKSLFLWVYIPLVATGYFLHILGDIYYRYILEHDRYIHITGQYMGKHGDDAYITHQIVPS